ncbi:hypothetical protein LXA43DRAFT_1162636 [Ganoderma leucocontextum]|nr:hypothetical protein LXA43DRAFT_1162636 [Ganoderma leucocontextum]
MRSPASRVTPLEEVIPFLSDPIESESVPEGVTTRSRSRKRAASTVDPDPRPTKKLRKGWKSRLSTQNEPSLSDDGGQAQTMTTQAARRHVDLLKDPHARMIDMYNVQCLKCGVTIKLSQKGLYDLHHWGKHRKRCDKWSEAYAAEKRVENCIESSRLSTPPPTPPLMEDCGTQLTGTSARSTSTSVSAKSLTPEPAAEKECATPSRRAKTTEPLSSHTQSAAAMALLHPDLEVLDLNKPLPTVPAWSWANIKPSTIVYRCTEWGRGSVLLSAADWDE